MNPPPLRHQAVLEAAAQRVKQAAQAASQRCVDSLGLAALSALKIRERDDFLAAQFELNRKLATFTVTFNDTLDRRIAADMAPRGDRARTRDAAPATHWEALRLVDDHEVEATISADRFGLAIQHACEWELRELDAYMGSLLQLGRPDHDRDPLRPELVGKALVAAVEAVSERPEVRKLLAAELGRSLASTMPRVYADIVADLRATGLQPVSLAFRSVDGPGNDLGRNTSGYEMASRPAELGSGDGVGLPSGGGPAPYAGGYGDAATHAGSTGYPGHSGYTESSRHGHPSGHGRASGPGTAAGRWAGSGRGSAPIGSVDAQLMSLIRRLAAIGNVAVDDAGLPVAGSSGYADELAGGGYAGGGATGPAPIGLPNLIHAHRDELRQASTGTLDHMVIDVVGSLFDQILSDPKVPPQMARQIARLQLPVLRVALGDPSFFSSRRHPVRRFVNRIASLACAFDDFGEEPGKRFLALVKELVQEIAAGDFDQMGVYEQKLAELEAFVGEQAQREVAEQGGDAAELLANKEHQLEVQQRYMRQLQSALSTIEMNDFLRDFLTQVWSQTLAVAARRGGESGESAQRMRRAARELVMSLQPKGSPADRKNFLLVLPQLMKDLNDGMDLIGWPERAKKDFFSRLLPAHAESLRGQSPRQLDYNLLVKQLDAVFAMPLPTFGELPRAEDNLPVLHDAVEAMSFSPDEAARIGLVAEASFDWDGTVDIVVGEPEITAVDIQIDGLPTAEAVEPASGASLAEHVQLGFAYQMHLEGDWQKVKLSYVSPGRAFFVFTRGRKHQKTISMTARMLKRLCDTGRLRAFENAFLLERATARARKQLAALKPGAAPATRQ